LPVCCFGPMAAATRRVRAGAQELNGWPLARQQRGGGHRPQAHRAALCSLLSHARTQAHTPYCACAPTPAVAPHPRAPPRATLTLTHTRTHTPRGPTWRPDWRSSGVLTGDWGWQVSSFCFYLPLGGPGAAQAVCQALLGTLYAPLSSCDANLGHLVRVTGT
jgi:hypothetical protein